MMVAPQEQGPLNGVAQFLNAMVNLLGWTPDKVVI